MVRQAHHERIIGSSNVNYLAVRPELVEGGATKFLWNTYLRIRPFV